MVILMGVQGMERPHRNMIHHRLLGNMELRQMVLILGPQDFLMVNLLKASTKPTVGWFI